MKRKPYGWGNNPAEAAALRRRLGLAVRRMPGPLPALEPKAYPKVVSGSELEPAQHVDAVLGALIDAHPDATLLEACAWLDPGIIAREMGGCGITEGNEESPDATLIARGQAENVGGSQQ